MDFGTGVSDLGSLGALLEATIAEEGCGLKDLTVLAAQHDPLRVDLTVPEPIIAGPCELPLVDSAWPHAAQCRALIDRKAYS
jgi:hypothetical protein